MMMKESGGDFVTGRMARCRFWVFRPTGGADFSLQNFTLIHLALGVSLQPSKLGILPK